jgi:hypothetical protein
MHPAQQQSFKNMTPEKKLQLSLDLYFSARKIKEAGLRKQHPDWSESRIKEKTREIFLYARA